ncbi:hexosaminidase [Saccharopolyspora erythraea NRRL 2338]|uniref:beta-N-acetylhexosaminidase n=2 Tax=Saccharopolyspora erythraea TaxID=1836 RepID=A4FGE7_SACEN|nr:beta-N-acetylhexosaminidase [Saccharopolyspora erythraea]EQD81557.1 beta-N-acetylhexosaminidase [Saccharopolyspora erythraea D]PFG96827.1 hexosaminidase [Saccharopolyspora erythraea NRRL 2338]QRK87066.1 beta-N-acetylhexosaminidase [Saccharopolyspora erythraea]CAM03122.1 beta-N-acetylhexosaminidase [Saccharopolyspora erythraea NRRL 2338]
MKRSSQHLPTRRATSVAALLTGALLTGGLLTAPVAGGVEAQDSRMHQVIPAPAHVEPDPAVEFSLGEKARISAEGEAKAVGDQLGEILRPSTGFELPVVGADPRPGDIALEIERSDDLGAEGYRLAVTGENVRIEAGTPAGLFNGVQTLRQLLPASVESDQVQQGPWTVPGGEITDQPRFGHRAAMLDVARHFFDVEQVKRYIDQISMYKVNRLHLHLSDDQGWRIQIKSWPRLAEYGGSTEVGGGPGGYYTQQDYTDIVNYAAERHILVVPEIDLPGHTNAALASYAELNCDGVAPPLYTGIEVGFSSLCVPKEITYEFVDDVLRELSAITPGPYLHIGGDEAHSTSEEDYKTFMGRVLPMVEKYGKTAVGWHEYAKAEPKAGSVLQYWGTTDSDPLLAPAVARGNKVLLSPANKSYLDMKYDADTELGLSWAGYIEVATAYRWNPGRYLQGVPEEAVLGVEAPLWSETLENSDHIEFMAFPRLPAIAELGWSPAATHDWESFRKRLAAQGPRLTALGIDFYRSPQVPWSK